LQESYNLQGLVLDTEGMV